MQACSTRVRLWQSGLVGTVLDESIKTTAVRQPRKSRWDEVGRLDADTLAAAGLLQAAEQEQARRAQVEVQQHVGEQRAKFADVKATPLERPLPLDSVQEREAIEASAQEENERLPPRPAVDLFKAIFSESEEEEEEEEAAAAAAAAAGGGQHVQVATEGRSSAMTAASAKDLPGPTSRSFPGTAAEPAGMQQQRGLTQANVAALPRANVSTPEGSTASGSSRAKQGPSLSLAEGGAMNASQELAAVAPTAAKEPYRAARMPGRFESQPLQLQHQHPLARPSAVSVVQADGGAVRVQLRSLAADEDDDWVEAPLGPGLMVRACMLQKGFRPSLIGSALARRDAGGSRIRTEEEPPQGAQAGMGTPPVCTFIATEHLGPDAEAQEEAQEAQGRAQEGSQGAEKHTKGRPAGGR